MSDANPRSLSTPRSPADADAVHDSSKKSNAAYKILAAIKKKCKSLNPFFLKGYDMPLTIEEQMDKKEIKTSDQQKLPYNLNRHILLAIYFSLIALTNRLFFGWPSLSNLLFTDEVYAWKCPKQADGTVAVPEKGKRYICKQQDVAVQNIFIVGSSAYYAFSFFNGLIVDYLGSRLSMLLGHMFNYIGWTLMLLSTENFDGFVVGGVFIAASIDLGSFSTLNVAGLYPGKENLMVNVISGAGSLSTGTMLLLDKIIHKTGFRFKNFMFWYISITVGVFFILTIFTFPRTRFFRQYEFDNYYKSREKELTAKTREDGHSSTMLEKEEASQGNSTLEHMKLSNLKKIHESYDEDSIGKKHIDVDLEKFHEEEMVLAGRRRSAESGHLAKHDTLEAIENAKGPDKFETVKDLLKICTGLHFIGLWIYGPLNTVYNNFYFSVVENILSTDKNDILGYLLPLSVIPCIILGDVADRFGIMLMYYYELFFAFAMYIFSYFRGEVWQWLSVISSTLYSACANGQLWTFISHTFSSRYVSTLIGLLNLVSGLFSLVRILLMKWAESVDYDFTYINMLMIILVGINALVAVYFVIIRKTVGEKVTIGDKIE